VVSVADAIPADIVAFVDQTTSQLRDLVEMNRHHVAFGCNVPLPCPGPDVLAEIQGLSCDRRDAVLVMAVAELAALGYGEAPVPLDLTDAARAVLADQSTEEGTAT
jgi:hypothetical protein